MNRKFTYTLLLVLIGLASFAQKSRSVQIAIRSNFISIYSNKIETLPANLDIGKYRTDSVTVIGEDNNVLITITPRTKCWFDWFESADSAYFYSGIWLPILHKGEFGRGMPALDLYVFKSIDDRIVVNKTNCFKGYELTSDSLSKIKAIYNKERRKVELVSEEKFDILKKEYPEDASWSSDLFYWCKLIAEWNEDENFIKVINNDFEKYSGDIQIAKEHELLLDNIRKVVKLKTKPNNR